MQPVYSEFISRLQRWQILQLFINIISPLTYLGFSP